MIKILGAENALKNGMRGTFTWKSWVGDVALSGSTVLVTFGAATFAAWGTTRYRVRQYNCPPLLHSNEVGGNSIVSPCIVTNKKLIVTFFVHKHFKQSKFERKWKSWPKSVS